MFKLNNAVSEEELQWQTLPLCCFKIQHCFITSHIKAIKMDMSVIKIWFPALSHVFVFLGFFWCRIYTSFRSSKQPNQDKWPNMKIWPYQYKYDIILKEETLIIGVNADLDSYCQNKQLYWSTATNDNSTQSGEVLTLMDETGCRTTF